MGEILLKSELKGERLELLAFGSWTAPHAGELETLVDGVAGEAGQSQEFLDRYVRCARIRHVRRMAARAPHPPTILRG